MPDWTKVEAYPESTVSCWCGAEYRSHAMFDKDTGRMISRKPCPQCRKNDNFRKVSSDPETMTL